MSDVYVSVQVETSPGVWLELEDELNGYSIGAGSFASRQVTHRQRKAGDVPWAEGALVTSSVRDLVVEPVEIYVEADSHFQFETRLGVVTAALEQLVFGLRRQIGDALVVWSCVPSDYSIESDQPLIVATQALVKCQVAHQPATTLSEVAVP